MEVPSFQLGSGQKPWNYFWFFSHTSHLIMSPNVVCSYFQNTSGIWPPPTISSALILVQVIISCLDYCNSLLQVYLLLQLLSLQLFSIQNPKWFFKNPSKITSLLCLRCSNGSLCQNKSQSSCIGLQDPYTILALLTSLASSAILIHSAPASRFHTSLRKLFLPIPRLTLSPPLGPLKGYLLWRSVLTFLF